ncbi:hypothetical protein EGR_03792 [Echinococcus granulosus]|uniref:Uncharacterized protein n=1 Tax=Echinococcus granulosus TaxID=6210 RepID=W6UJJ4_ECHGR|nr:hypothetical protein EGR_03792 [Echinococcus granulosus]EUB61306.1 hypothetical protein EGR_03792 [Echinococcus granulosus]
MVGVELNTTSSAIKSGFITKDSIHIPEVQTAIDAGPD